MMCFLRTKLVLIVFLSVLLLPSSAIRSFPGETSHIMSMQFLKAPEYLNRHKCPSLVKNRAVSVCNPLLMHIAMTLDSAYLRGSMAAIHSVLKHSSCPENIFFHFIASDSSLSDLGHLIMILQSTFPSLNFKVYIFNTDTVKNLISPSVRQALENPLNYARSYLGNMIDPCVERVIYLDSDIIVIDDIEKLWGISLSGSRAIGAPEYCHANFTNYFTDEFWSDPEFNSAFEGKRPCYFNTGVMVMDLGRWRRGDYTERIEEWMRIQKERRIYKLGSLPPFLLVFGGDVEAIDHRWNQHGLGGDNVGSSCRSMHAGPVSLMHWSGKGKPWMRLDAGLPCPVDLIWVPYDLYKLHQKF